MAGLLRFKALTAIASFCFVLPAFVFSQVIIREKVETKPRSADKETIKPQAPPRTADASDRFYNPPRFGEHSGSSPIQRSLYADDERTGGILGAIEANHVNESLIFHSLFSTLQALTNPVFSARSDTAS